MQVDMRVEPLVREAFTAAVNRDGDASQRALQAIADRGVDDAAQALSLALAVDAAALFDVHDDTRPTDEQIGDLAESFVEMESWAQIDHETAVGFLSAVADGRNPDDVLGADEVPRAVFVVGGWLLASFLNEGEKWHDYLDELLNTLEQTSAQP